MRFVDKIAKSKYFQKATETEFIKKKMEEVANTPLLLTVEVQECRGTLAVNIPPPQTDRIWYVYTSCKKREKQGCRLKRLETPSAGQIHTDGLQGKTDPDFSYKLFFF